ncbi:Dabb family protein [Burkholderia guangdongensis]|uniref:Dabb family protein n=1 Tax=Burkholderia guangdongensis TaxID=1792500 RepID=UPI0015CA0EF7|nr:Dabb family protein [Burkholderia guangdongensis]
MRHETAQVFVHERAAAGDIARALQAHAQALPGVRRAEVGCNLEGSWGAGDCTLDLLVDDGAPACAAAVAGLAELPGIARIDHASCAAIDGGLREPGLRDGVWRTLMFRVRAQASDAQVAALERELLQMPAYMRGIRNWRLSRVTSPGPWTHVWQQEFAQVGDLLGEYLMHPFHWGWVDRRFDVECPDWTVEAISHAFCPLASSLLTEAAG